MWWKIYFWFYTVLSVVGALGLILGKDLMLIDIGYMVLLVVSLFGLFSFVYQKKLFSGKFWMVIFWISVLTTGLYTLYALAPHDQYVQYLSWINGSFGTSSKLTSLVSVLFDLPLYIALYKLGTGGKVAAAKPAKPSKKKKK